MKDRKWFRRLSCFYKIFNNQAPAYLHSLLPLPSRHYIIYATIPKLDRFSAEQKLLVIVFLPHTVREWNRLDTSICQASLFFSISQSTFRLYLTNCKQHFWNKCFWCKVTDTSLCWFQPTQRT